MWGLGVSAPWALRTDRTYKTYGTDRSFPIGLIGLIGPI